MRLSGASVTRRILLLMAVCAFIVVPSCGHLGIGFVKIGDLLAKPEKYAGQEVRIHGTVSDVLQIPLVSIALYEVNDGTGGIVVSTDRGAPLSGSQVRAKGVLETVASINGKNIGLHLREVERW